MNKNQKGFSVVEAILLLVIVGMIGGVGYYAYNSQKDTKPALDNSTKTSENTSAKTVAKVDQYNGWKTYENTAIGFTLKYPPDLTMEQPSVGDGPNTLATDKSPAIEISSKNSVFFSLSMESNTKLNQEFVYHEFGDGYGAVKSKTDYTITNVTRSGIPGYKVTLKPSIGAVSDFYFLQKNNDSNIYKITVLKTPNTSSKIFDSLDIN